VAGGLEPPASAADSIEAAVGGANAEHFLVGTQDVALRERLRQARAPRRAARACAERPQVRFVPQLFVAASGVSLELPTEAQRAEAVCTGALRPPALTRAQGGRSAVPEHERVALALQPGAATAVHTTVRFKRNKAKGPNPLSVKKRRVAPAPAAPTAAGVGEEARALRCALSSCAWAAGAAGAHAPRRRGGNGKDREDATGGKRRSDGFDWGENHRSRFRSTTRPLVSACPT